MCDVYLFPASLLVVDRAGRRVLLMISGTVMAVCMGGLATYLTLGEAVPGADTYHF